MDYICGERCKKVDGYDDYYITDTGRIFSKRLRGAEKEPHLHEIFPKDPGNDKKYMNIILCKDGKQDTKSVHRLVAEAFVDGRFDGAVVNHKDGNNRNNSYVNLEWVTQKENIHKSYVTSGMDQHRNIYAWTLVDPLGGQIGVFNGLNNLKKYVQENLPGISASMLAKYKQYKGYKIHTH